MDNQPHSIHQNGMLFEWDESTGTYYSLQVILRCLFSQSKVPCLVLRSDLTRGKLERLGMTADQLLEPDC